MVNYVLVDTKLPSHLTKEYEGRELADTGFVLVQNFVKLGLYLKK